MMLLRRESATLAAERFAACFVVFALDFTFGEAFIENLARRAQTHAWAIAAVAEPPDQDNNQDNEKHGPADHKEWAQEHASAPSPAPVCTSLEPPRAGQNRWTAASLENSL